MKVEEILAKLIEFKTYEGNEQKSEEVDALYEFYISQISMDKYHYKIVEKNGSKSLLIYSRSLESPKVVLQAHIDVVPARDKSFSPIIKGGKLFGRGASDMKFAAASFIKVLESVKDNDIAIWLTSDEEVGGFDGVNFLLNGLKLKTEFCILPDGSNDDAVVIKAKGVRFVDLISKGSSAHGSKPWLGKNAIDNLIDAYNELRSSDIFQEDKQEHWQNTLNAGKIEGGNATNNVADFAKLSLDFRFIDDESNHKYSELLKNLTDKYGTEAKEIISGPYYKLDLENPYVEKYLSVLKDSGVEYHLANDHGSSDARFFKDVNIPVIMHKPICGGDHTDEEWINIDSLNLFTQNLIKFVSSL